jgi:DNA-binding MarR family transcriptional regulator
MKNKPLQLRRMEPGLPSALPASSMLPLWRRISREFLIHGQKWGMPPNSGLILLHLHRHPECSEPAEMAAANYFPRQTMTFILDSMEKEGLVVRKPHANDRRRKIVQLTATGRKLAESIFQDLLQFEATAIRAIGAADLEAIHSLLNRYADTLAAQNDREGIRRHPGRCACGFDDVPADESRV